MELKIKCGRCRKVFTKKTLPFNLSTDAFFKCIFCKTKNKISFDDRRLKEISQAEKLREDAKDIALEAQARRNEEIEKIEKRRIAINDEKIKILSEKEHNLKVFGRFISNEKIRNRVTVQLTEEDKILLDKIPDKKNYSSLKIEENFEKYGVRKSNKEIRALLDLPDYKKETQIEKNRNIQQEKQLKQQEELARIEAEEKKNYADTGLFETDKERELRLKSKGELEKEKNIQENINKFTKELYSVFPGKNVSIDIHNLIKIWGDRSEWEQQNRFTKIKFKNGVRIAIKPCPIACSSAMGKHKYLFNKKGITSLSENQKNKFSTYPCKNGFGYHLSSNKNGNEVYDEANWEEYL